MARLGNLVVTISIALIVSAIPSRADDSQTSNIVASETNLSEHEGERALDLGEYARAETLFQDYLKRASKNDPNRAYLQTGLSEALINQGKIAEAAKEYKKAEVLVEQKDRPTELTARLYDGLSWLYHAQGKLDDAVSYSHKALEVRKSIEGASGILLVGTLVHLGQLLELSGQLGEANQYYLQAIDFQDRQAGPNSLQAADIQEKVASVYRRLGDPKRASQYFQQALNIKLSRQASLAAYTPHPYWEAVNYPYVDGSPNCTKRFDQGCQQELITANGVTVAASLKSVDSSKSTEICVIVHNDSAKNIQFLPVPPIMTVIAPKIEVVPQVDPNKLATSIQKKGDRKAAWIRFWGSQATQTMTTTCIGQGGFFGYPGAYGGYGYGMPYNSFASRSGNMSFMTTSVPDYAAQARALQRAADVSGQAHQNASTIKSSGLGPTTIGPGQVLSGSLFFDTNKISDATVTIPIGNAVYKFRFPPR